MDGTKIRIGVVAPGSPIGQAVADRVTALATRLFGDRAPEIHFHPQCWLSQGHFAGDDATRAAAFLEIANDPTFNALWIARGGYGACRIAEEVVAGLAVSARAKTYLGYSDAGSLLAALYKEGFADLAHGPMPADIMREDGEAAVARALGWLVDRTPEALEPTVAPDTPTAAFNITILSQLLGTPLEPDLAGHVLMLEEVAEQMYRIDRAMFHISSNPGIRRVAGLRLGRCDPVPPNEPDFGEDEESVIRRWCARSGIPYLGRADIGHDAANKVVPFGTRRSAHSPIDEMA